MMTRNGMRKWFAAAAIAAGGCGQTGVPGGADTSASVTVALTQAPSDAGCIVVRATSAREQSFEFDTTPGQSTIFPIRGLPTGTVVFDANAFDSSCAARGAAEPSWVSDSVAALLAAGNNGAVTLKMQRRVGARVAVDFPGDAEGRSWLSFDGSPAGTPAEAVIAPIDSDANKTVLSLTLHGVFTKKRLGPDNKEYTQIEVPGLGTLGQVGAPALPVARFDLGVVTSAQEVRLAGAEILESRALTDILVWPQPVPERDQAPTTGQAPGSSPERFQLDDKIYGGRAQFPGTPGRALSPVRPKLGALDGATVELSPIQFDPLTGGVTIATKSSFTFAHEGAIRQLPGITKENGRDAAATFVNWAAIERYRPINVIHFFANFLFIYPPGYRDAVLPLIQQKQARGFVVAERTTTQTGTSCAQVRAAINAWYAGTPAWGDHYAILVGDVNQIAVCTAPTGDESDDLYGSVDGDNLDKEVHVGRLSVDSTTDAANQVEKILRYEDSPEMFFNYGRSLLVAHKENAPGKYVGAHESVRTASYAVPPAFSTLYGHVGGIDNLDVIDAIGDGRGIVAYRGHGDVGEWWHWNTLNQSFFNSDVASVANAATRVPIVWSIACLNANLPTSDSIAEVWMRNANNRAVAHYGATQPSYTDPNHELDRRLFKGIFDNGITTHSRAIAYAEKQMNLSHGTWGETNSWMYLLLGDPEMRVRRGPQKKLILELPLSIELACAVGQCPPRLFAVRDELGQPVPGALISVWKEGEVFDNAYTDEKGVVQLTIPAKTPGRLVASVRADDGDPIGTAEVPVR